MTPTATAQLSASQALSISIGAIKQAAVRKRIALNPIAFVPSTNAPTVNVPLQNVGILRGCLIKTTLVIANTDGALDGTASDFAMANMYSQMVYNDFSNVTRIQTTGAHIYMLDSIKRRGIFGAAYTNDNPAKFGANWAPFVAPVLTHGTSKTVIGYHYVPAMYSDDYDSPDFRGAVFSNLTNVNQSLNLTFAVGPNLCVPTGTDSVNAIYGGVPTANVSITSAVVQVYQDVYDQLPDYRFLPRNVTPAMWQAATGDDTGLLLPNAAMKFIYELKWSPLTGLAQAVENPIPYTNQRQYLSTIAQYGNPTRTFGTDISYWRLVAANSYEWWKMDPLTIALEARRILGDDLPAGFYLFDSRKKPINTNISGNVQLVINPSTATAGTAYVNVFYEDFALAASLTGGPSFPGSL